MDVTINMKIRTKQSFDLKGEIIMFEFFVAVLGLFIMSKYEKWEGEIQYKRYMEEQERRLNLK